MDHLKFAEREINPKEAANSFSNVLFFYSWKIFSKSFRKEDDLFEVPEKYQSKKLYNQLRKKWDEEKNKKNPSIFWLLWKCYGIYYFTLGIIRIIVETTIILFQSYAVGKTVSYFVPGQNSITKNNAYLYATLIIFLGLLKCIFIHNNDLLIAGLGIRARSAFSSFIYRKSLKLDSVNFGKSIIGKIITLITKDVQAFETYVQYGNEIWAVIIKLIVLFIILYARIGLTAVIGNAIVWVLIPIQIYLGKKVAKYKTEMSKRNDETHRVVQEILSSIKLVKMFNWEKILETKISDVRRKEVNLTHKLFYIQVMTVTLSLISVNTALYVLLTVYTKLGNQLTAEIMFFILACFNNLITKVKLDLPLSIYFTSHLIASGTRIENIMKTQTLQKVQTNCGPIIQPRIYFDDVSLTVNNKQILKKINLEIEKGLTIIKGPTTSGKTSLLKMILQEYKPDHGILEIRGTISYASQEPWLFPSTIKQNILFGEYYDERRYRQVLHVCALEYDISLLENGDLTIVEDRGANLSKGQQVRINLARAVYKKKDIYLLDDCLTSLDGQVSCFIFKECIKKFLQNKIVILAIHNICNHQNADKVIILEHGEIKIDKQSFKWETDVKSGHTNDSNVLEKCGNSRNELEYANEYTPFLTQNKIKSKIYLEETKLDHVDGDVYKRYIESGGGFVLFFIILFTFMLAQISFTYTDKLASSWVNMEQDILNLTITNEINTTDFAKLVERRDNVHYLYTVFTIVTVILFLLRANAIFVLIRKTAIQLHKKISKSVLNASMQFFDKNFLGSILNRFSKDFFIIDTIFPFIIFHFAIFVFKIMGMLILIIYVNTLFLVPTTILLLIMFIIRKYYLRTSRNLKRLEAITRSPVIGYLNATLEGMLTIRALNLQKKLTDEFDRHQDLYTSTSFTYLCCMKSFVFITDTLCTIFMSIVVLSFLIIEDKQNLPGNVGLAISQAFMFSGILHIAINTWAEVENEMISVERVLQYVDIKQENKTGLVLKNWPKYGEIKYQNVYLFYPNSDLPTLKNLNFTISPGEKIAIVGRTGSGKSSIISTLFRLYEFKGQVTIDGVNIKTLSLDFLRSKISVIPQDVTVFNGTIRDNIDPNKQLTDKQILEIIDSVNLQNFIPNLDFKIVENGAHLSVGQKQLICLIRALIIKNKIVILDEAMASLDPEMESIIHIITEILFKNSTILVIAHKMYSIINCDKVMVLNEGEVVAFDSSEFLIKNTGLLDNLIKNDNSH